jgi:integrase
LSYAASEGVIAANPAIGVKRPTGRRRSRRLGAAEYAALGKAILAAESDLEAGQVTGAAWLLALTGCRLGEVRNLKWAEVDEANGCFRLEDSKEGVSVRPVGQTAFKSLHGIRRTSDYVFAGVRRGGSFGGLSRGWRRLMKRAKLEGVTPHTLRHSYASVAADLGYTESTIAALLGHSAGSVTARYIHNLDAVLIAAADKVSNSISETMTGRLERV